MMPLYEIVPNLSEGRDSVTIDAAAAAVERGGARLIDRSSDGVHHRSVLTVVGDEAQVLEAAVALAGVALRTHRSARPSRRSSAHRVARRSAVRPAPWGRSPGSRGARPPRRGRDLAALPHPFLLLRRGGEAQRAPASARRPPQYRVGSRRRRRFAPRERRSDCHRCTRDSDRVQRRACDRRSRGGPSDRADDSGTRRRPALASGACIAARAGLRAGFLQCHGLSSNAPLSYRRAGGAAGGAARCQNLALRAGRLPSLGSGGGFGRVLFGSY